MRSPISRTDRRWAMYCDRPGCTTRSEPFDTEPPLAQFVAAGWFIGVIYGDHCPACLAAGHVPTAAPHPLMRTDLPRPD